jgi:hypothetical protein
MDCHKNIRLYEAAEDPRIFTSNLELNTKLKHIVLPSFHVIFVIDRESNYISAQECTHIRLIIGCLPAVTLIAPLVKAWEHQEFSDFGLIGIH